MSEFSAKGLALALEQKGFTEMVSFYSTSFDFIDGIEEGLKRVEQHYKDGELPQKFNMSFYPVWENDGKPHVRSFITCRFEKQKINIQEVSLDFMGSAPTQELESIELSEPTLAEIPSKQQLHERLRQLTAPLKAASKKSRQRIK